MPNKDFWDTKLIYIGAKFITTPYQSTKKSELSEIQKE
jgi:hypothetical protein